MLALSLGGSAVESGSLTLRIRRIECIAFYGVLGLSIGVLALSIGGLAVESELLLFRSRRIERIAFYTTS